MAETRGGGSRVGKVRGGPPSTHVCVCNQTPPPTLATAPRQGDVGEQRRTEIRGPTATSPPSPPPQRWSRGPSVDGGRGVRETRPPRPGTRDGPGSTPLSPQPAGSASFASPPNPLPIRSVGRRRPPRRRRGKETATAPPPRGCERQGRQTHDGPPSERESLPTGRTDGKTRRPSRAPRPGRARAENPRHAFERTDDRENPPDRRTPRRDRDKSLCQGLTFNRSQRGSCSATHETPTQKQVVYE